MVDLDNFTNNFPMDLVGDAIESAVPGVGDVTIGNPSSVSQSLPVGIPEPAGGLNFTRFMPGNIAPELKSTIV